MGKQTDTNKNKLSKKNYSFTGQRIIEHNKSNLISEANSESNTTEDMRKILESDKSQHTNVEPTHIQNSMFLNNEFNQLQQPNVPMQSYMQQPNVPMQQPYMQQPYMQQPNVPMQPSMQMMNPMTSNINQFMGVGDVDPTLANTLAPINNVNNDFSNIDPYSLMNSSQMAQKLSNLANLGSNSANIANQYVNQYTNQLSDMNMSGMNNIMPQSQDPINYSGLKHLASLNTRNILKP